MHIGYIGIGLFLLALQVRIEYLERYLQLLGGLGSNGSLL